MTNHPTITTMIYKDNHISVKIPIRVRKIELVKYSCKVCGLNGTLTSIVDYIKEHAAVLLEGLDYIKWNYDLTINRDIPIDLIKDRNTVYCPVCNKRHNKKIVMTKEVKYLYCVYINKLNPYIRLDKLVSEYLPLKWKVSKRGGYTTMAAYFEDYDGLVRQVQPKIRRYENCNTHATCKLEAHKITRLIVEADYNHYLMRKCARKI